MSEAAVRAESVERHQAPDATIDEVGTPGQAVGFSGSPLHSRAGNGHGTGDPNSPGWAGWGGGGV